MSHLARTKPTRAVQQGSSEASQQHRRVGSSPFGLKELSPPLFTCRHGGTQAIRRIRFLFLSCSAHQLVIVIVFRTGGYQLIIKCIHNLRHLYSGTLCQYGLSLSTTGYPKPERFFPLSNRRAAAHL